MKYPKGNIIYYCLVMFFLLALGILAASSPARAEDDHSVLVASSAQQPFVTAFLDENAPPGNGDLDQYQPQGAGEDAENLLYCSPDIPDMLAYWPLNDLPNPTATKLTFANVVAPAYNGFCTKPGCPTRLPAGRVGAAYTFSALNNPPTNLPDQIDVVSYPKLDWTVNESFSFETWVNIPASANCSGNRVFIGRRGQGVLSIWLGCVDGTNKARFSVRDNSGIDLPPGRYIADGKTALNDGKWHHVVGVRDATANKLNLYVDGALEGSVNTAYQMGFSGGKPLGIGYFNTGFEPYYFLEGSLDEVAVYKRALTLANVKSHWNGGTGKSYCSPGSRLSIPLILYNFLAESRSSE